MKRFEAKISIKDDVEDGFIGCFETENYRRERHFKLKGYADTSEEIHDWLLGQVARVLNVEDILRGYLEKRE